MDMRVHPILAAALMEAYAHLRSSRRIDGSADPLRPGRRNWSEKKTGATRQAWDESDSPLRSTHFYTERAMNQTTSTIATLPRILAAVKCALLRSIEALLIAIEVNPYRLLNSRGTISLIRR